MSAPCAILMNEQAGKHKQTASIEEMQKLVDTLGVGCQVVGTQSPQETVERLRDMVAQKVPRVAVAGGDGTVRLAAQELAHSDTALGIVPQGTANNFATALRLPEDLPSALRVLEEGDVREVDLGRVGEKRYFTESAGVGLFANALAVYGHANKDFLRGLYALLKIVFALRASRVTLTIDGMHWTEPCVSCEIANTFRMGTGLPVAPGAKVTDGMLDVVTFGNLARGELLPYYRAVRQQLHQTLPKVGMHLAREIVAESRRKMPVHADDRILGATPMIITAAPAALKVLVERL